MKIKKCPDGVVSCFDVHYLLVLMSDHETEVLNNYLNSIGLGRITIQNIRDETRRLNTGLFVCLFVCLFKKNIRIKILYNYNRLSIINFIFIVLIVHCYSYLPCG